LKNNKVLIAMSGGIDSTVAAILLKQQNYDLVGLTFKPYSDNLTPDSEFNSEKTIEDAIKVSKKLNIEHHVIDIDQEFNKYVISNFISEYLNGNTPNPCVICNKHIKWGLLYEKALSLGCNKIATGHYANIIFQNNRYFLSKGADSTKDQTYFLWQLTQEQLSNTIFPLGEFTKEKVKEIAIDNGFTSLSKKRESQEICFIPNDNYRDFLETHIPDIHERFKPGIVKDVNGKVLGEHTGLYKYTIGQRKGLGIATGIPMYVVSIDLKNNTLVLGTKDDLNEDEFFVTNTNFMKFEDIPENGLKILTKIRYRNKGVPGTVYKLNDKTYKVKLDNYIDAVTPGQSAVFFDFYNNNHIIGGGIIANC
jgi:tRNA-specific 2-thiouridylase